MKSNPCISVIIPVYNVEAYLKQCLDSVVNQTLRDIEIICVNDGSTDGSLAILEEYAATDSRIKVVNKENGGLSDARNAGMKHAIAEWVVFVDSDDYLELNAYEEAYKATSENPDVITFGVNIVDGYDEQRVIDEYGYFHCNHTGMVEVTNDITYTTNVTAWNKLFKRKLIEENEVIFPKGLIYEDNGFFFCYMMHASKIFFIQERLVNYRHREDSIMSKTFNGDGKELLSYFGIIRFIYNYIENNGGVAKHTDYFFRAFAHCFYPAYFQSPIGRRDNVLDVASSELDSYALPRHVVMSNPLMKSIKNKSFNKPKEKSLMSKIGEFFFSIRKEPYGDAKKKVVRLFGLTIYSKVKK